MPEPIILSERYILEKTLGRGGMATVYQARDRTLERTVAIKVLREDYSSDRDFRDRFHQEAKAAANLVHPNIVTVHDFGMDGGRLYIVMEYVPGTDLNTLLHKRGRFSEEETITLMRQACAGIGYAHRAGLVHCDVKPHNFLITPDNRLKVTDFGIARALESIVSEEQNGVVWGSPQYFSPEQARGKPPTPASDVYSLGVVLYYMLTGRLPFTAASAVDIARMHRYETPVPPTQFNPTITPVLEALLLKVLAKEASQRYRTADQLGRVLMTLEASKKNPELVNSTSVKNLESGEDQTNRKIPVKDLPRRESPGKQLRPNSLKENLDAKFHSEPGTISYPNTPTITSGQEKNVENPFDIDWITLGMGLLALIAVGGLIPLWVWIYLLYFPPTP